MAQFMAAVTVDDLDRRNPPTNAEADSRIRIDARYEDDDLVTHSEHWTRSHCHSLSRVFHRRGRESRDSRIRLYDLRLTYVTTVPRAVIEAKVGIEGLGVGGG